MRIDEYKTLVRETEAWPGNIGNSCAETSRLYVLTPQYRTQLNLDAFITPTGFLLHPTAPASAPGTGENWREPDFSVDQALPLVLAKGLKGTWTFIPGTKALVNPALWCAVRGHWRLLALTVMVQALLFKLPWRWSDSTKSFERTSGSSADYLNYATTIVFLSRLGIRLPRKTMDVAGTMAKIRDYYANEPNSAWIVKAYEDALAV